MAMIYEDIGELVVVRCWCGVQHAIPDILRKAQIEARDRGSNKVVFCPLGHEYIARGESETKKLEDQLVAERARHDQTKAELEHTEARRRGEAAAKTRIKNRVSNGVCPCCKRSFANLAKHMTCKHPGYASKE